jgi:hypothetical protein
LLKENLHRATFLVRDENGDQFRFARSSLQERFWACYSQRALEESALPNWALRGVSRETLDFLEQGGLGIGSSPFLNPTTLTR